MILKTSIHKGYAQTSAHCMKVEDNENIVDLGTENMISNSWLDATKEMHMIGMLSNNIQYSMAHIAVNSDPSEPALTSDQFKSVVMKNWDNEFKTSERPCASVEHLKKNRGHFHQMKSLVGDDFKNIRMDHWKVRQEKVARISEFELGHKFTSGAFNRKVIEYLKKDGRDDVATAMEKVGLHKNKKTAAVMNHKEWQQEVRTDVKLDDVRTGVLFAWKSSDSGPALQVALDDFGLTLVQGRKTVGVLDGKGHFHGLLRSINAGSKKEGNPLNLKKADIDARLGGIVLPSTEAKTLRQQLVPDKILPDKNSNTKKVKYTLKPIKVAGLLQANLSKPTIIIKPVTMDKIKECDSGASKRRDTDARKEEQVRRSEDKAESKSNIGAKQNARQNAKDQKVSDSAAKYQDDKDKSAAEWADKNKGKP